MSLMSELLRNVCDRERTAVPPGSRPQQRGRAQYPRLGSRNRCAYAAGSEWRMHRVVIGMRGTVRPLSAMSEFREAGRVTRSKARQQRLQDSESLDLAVARLQKVSNKLAAVLVPLFSRPVATPATAAAASTAAATKLAVSTAAAATASSSGSNAATQEGSSGVREEVRVLLTQRSTAVRTHKGEVCLPGGKREPEDTNDITTALREANEELGLQPSNAQVLGCFYPFLSKHALSVTPVVATVPADRAAHAPAPDASEVAEVFDVPLSLFLSRSHHSSQDIKWQDHTYRIHYFDYEGHTIWGLTASILIKIARVAFEREPEFQETAPRGVDYSRFWHDGTKVCVHTVAGDTEGFLDNP